MPWETMEMKHRTSCCKCIFIVSAVLAAARLPHTSLPASWQAPATPVTVLATGARRGTVCWALF